MKKSNHHLLNAILVLLIFTLTVTAAESLSVLLQKGIFAEETEGNMDAAIKIYEGIAKDGEANRSLVAQAQYRLGMCQLKRGKKDEAEDAFRKILERFPGETDFLAKAQERLGEMGKASSLVAVRQLWAPAAARGHSVSPDGRYLSFTDWDTGDLAIRDLTTGKNRRLTDKGPWEKSGDFTDISIFSPDGKQVAYSWYLNRDRIELRIISLDDLKPRVLMAASSTNSWIQPTAWSEDSIAVTESLRGGETLINLVSATRGTVRKLKSLPSRNPDRLCFSADGRYLAYSCAGEKNPESDIYLIDLMSGAETTLVEHPADDKVVGWHGQKMLFTSDRKGGTHLWAFQVQGAQVVGEPVLLKAEMGDVSILGQTRSGALYYGISRGGVGLYRAAVDLESGRVLSTQQEVPHPPGEVLQASLSPNGRYLAYYLSRRGGLDWPELFVLDFQTHQHRPLYSVHSAQRVYAVQWLPDNRTLVHRGDRSAGDQELSLIDAQTGAVTSFDGTEAKGKLISEIASDGETLAYVVRDTQQKRFMIVRRDRKTGQTTKSVLLNEPDWTAFYYFKFTPDLKALFYSVAPTERSADRLAVAMRRDLTTGRESEVMRENSILVPFPLSDPTLVAFAGLGERDEITMRLFRFSEDQHRELWTTKAPGPIYFLNLFGFRWTPDGRYLIYHREQKTANGNERQAWTITVETGQVRQLEPAVPKLYRVVGIPPDGKQLFFQAFNESANEIWVMENFLPQVAQAK